MSCQCFLCESVLGDRKAQQECHRQSGGAGPLMGQNGQWHDSTLVLSSLHVDTQQSHTLPDSHGATVSLHASPGERCTLPS